MNKSIDWNAVTVGETELLDKHGTRRLVLTVYGNMVGTKIQSGDYITDFGWWRKQDITDWTIDDPWEEITDKCRFVKEEYTPASWHLMYGDLCIYHGSKKYKISEDGRRVWKRKEGDR